jgi:hypothetical protein
VTDPSITGTRRGDLSTYRLFIRGQPAAAAILAFGAVVLGSQNLKQPVLKGKERQNRMQARSECRGTSTIPPT